MNAAQYKKGKGKLITETAEKSAEKHRALSSHDSSIDEDFRVSAKQVFEEFVREFRGQAGGRGEGQATTVVKAACCHNVPSWILPGNIDI